MFQQHRHHTSWAGPAGLSSVFLNRMRHQRQGRQDDEWDWPPFGRRWRRPGRQTERLFDKGDLKYVILELLWQQPRHGYDIIRALEERFHGLYSPSPGAVYPTLQLLEDQGYVTGDQRDGKKVFTVTDAGRELLATHAEALEAIRKRTATGHSGDARAELHELLGELRDLAGSVFRHATRGALTDPERVRQLRAILARTRAEVDAVLAGERPSSML